MLVEPILNIQPFFEDAIIPKRAYPTDSGLDLYVYSFEKYYKGSIVTENIYAKEDTLILYPHERVLVNTGISATVGKGYEIQIRPRSGLALKSGITVCNTPGTIDESYRGIIGVILLNTSQIQHKITKGDRIAQMVVAPVVLCEVKVVDDLKNTKRSSGGFGSTDI